MIKNSQTDIPAKLPLTPEMEVWKYEDDIGFPILLSLLFFGHIAAFVFCIIQIIQAVLR